MESEELQAILRPWIIVDEAECGNRTNVRFYGPEGATEEHFCIHVSNIVHHLAIHFNVTEERIMDLIQRELDEPRTELFANVTN